VVETGKSGPKTEKGALLANKKATLIKKVALWYQLRHF